MKKSDYEDINIPAKMHSRNEFKVPRAKWREWSKLARRVFNDVYSSMTDSAWAFQAPSIKAVTGRAWKTTAWNSAWIAADAVKEAGS